MQIFHKRPNHFGPTLGILENSPKGIKSSFMQIQRNPVNFRQRKSKNWKHLRTSSTYLFKLNPNTIENQFHPVPVANCLFHTVTSLRSIHAIMQFNSVKYSRVIFFIYTRHMIIRRGRYVEKVATMEQ